MTPWITAMKLNLLAKAVISSDLFGGGGILIVFRLKNV